MISAAVVFTALCTTANGWVFDACGVQFDSTGNFGCTARTCNTGDTIDYSVGWTESCTLRVYDDASCHVQIGISSDDWHHQLTRPMRGFDIRDC